MDAETRDLILNDALEIAEGLSSFSAYSFGEDIDLRMESAQLSSAALAARCGVSHTIIDNYRRGKAKPNGKERMKELGMALGMSINELDGFLYKNGYPRLYAKSPLDAACRMTLISTGCEGDVVKRYREMLERLNLKSYAPPVERAPLPTGVMSMELDLAAEHGKLSGWFRRFSKNFSADAKNLMPDVRIIRYAALFMKDATINEMAVTGELPTILRNLLYPVFAGKAVPMRFLREKLIAFGLFVNMTEEESDSLLGFAKLRPLTEPISRLDFALLGAVRTGHERYPLYEYENTGSIVKQLENAKDPYDRMLLLEYNSRLKTSGAIVDYYERRELSDEERLFTKKYTSYSDRGLMDYVYDVLSLLVGEGALKSGECAAMLELIARSSDGRSVWS